MACVFGGNWYNLGFPAVWQGGCSFANSNKMRTAVLAADVYLENGVPVFWSSLSLLTWLDIQRAKKTNKVCSQMLSQPPCGHRGSKANMKCGHVSLKGGHTHCGQEPSAHNDGTALGCDLDFLYLHSWSHWGWNLGYYLKETLNSALPSSHFWNTGTYHINSASLWERLWPQWESLWLSSTFFFYIASFTL